MKNWPRCYPILHHDIAAEVPAGRQRLVGAGYLTWILVCTAYLYNWLLITIMQVQLPRLQRWHHCLRIRRLAMAAALSSPLGIGKEESSARFLARREVAPTACTTPRCWPVVLEGHHRWAAIASPVTWCFSHQD